MKATTQKNSALDVIAAMYVDHIFDLSAAKGPRDNEVDDGAYATDEKDERSATR